METIILTDSFTGRYLGYVVTDANPKMAIELIKNARLDIDHDDIQEENARNYVDQVISCLEETGYMAYSAYPDIAVIDQDGNVIQ